VDTSKQNPIVFLTVAVHYGGSKEVTVNLARYIQKTNKVAVVDAHGNCKEYMSALSAANIKTHIAIPNTNKGIIGGRSFVDRSFKICTVIPEFVALIIRLRKLFKQISPKVVVITSEKALFLAKCSLGHNIPIVYYSMGSFSRHPWYTEKFWSSIDLVIGLSKSCLEWLETSKNPPCKTVVVYNGVDIDEVINDSKKRVKDLPGMDKPLKLLFPASIIASKGQDVAIKAVAKFRESGNDVQLWLSSSRPRGAEKQYPSLILDMISEFGLWDCVSFIGWRENIFPVMAASDIVVLTSKAEGMPCCLMQAMVLNKPIIATKVGGIPEFVHDGVDGFLVDYGDVEGVLIAMQRLTNANLRKQMGASGQKRIKEHFSLQRQTADFLRQVNLVVDK